MGFAAFRYILVTEQILYMHKSKLTMIIEKKYHLRLFILAVSIIMMSSCAMRQVHMRAMRPAPITAPQHMQTILILDRTAYENKNNDIIGGILSKSLPGERENAVQEALNGVQNKLGSSSRYSVIRATEILTGSNLSTTFPTPLPWAEVNQLCNKYNTDGIVALELFDTKFIIDKGVRDIVEKIKDGDIEKEVKKKQFYAKGIGTSNLGFRLYDPKQQSIIDQKMFTENSSWEKTATSANDAIALLIDKGEAMKQVSYNAGINYGARITPVPITITRPFYDRPKKSAALTKGSRLADTNQWDKAIETWSAAISGADVKIAGRLAYNVAIAYEVLGDFVNAKKWAAESWVSYGNKEAKEYSDNLNYRIRQENLLKEQMGDQ